jgi:hypothetical protein
MPDGNKKAVILTVGGFEHGYLEKERLEGLLLRKLFSLQAKISFGRCHQPPILLPLTGSNPKKIK